MNRFLRIVGKSFIAAGVLILLFLAYQLLGTNFVTDNHQKDLEKEFERAIASGPAVPVANPEEPDLGDAVARIEIPKIDISWLVVEGISVEALKKGPGHVPGMALPGEKGNVVISGHRTTYGAPFHRLDEVAVGDTIRLRTRNGPFLYRITEVKIVAPTDLSVVVPTEDARLTLTTCHPKYSAAKRLIVVGVLVENQESGVT
jgi:sortase A